MTLLTITIFQCLKLKLKLVKIEFKKKYLQTSLNMRAKDFEMIQNVEDEKQKELIKSIVGPLDGQVVNDKITVSEYTWDENNIGIPTKIAPNIS